MADLEGRLKISWPNTVALARLADEMDFESLVPVARWRGFGGKLNPAGPGLRDLHLGLGDRRLDQRTPARRHLALVEQPSHRRGETGDGHRPHHQRPHDPRLRHRLEQAGDRHVRRRDAAARRTLRHGRGMARTSSSGFGPRTTNSTMRASYYRIVKGYLQPKSIQRPFPAIMNAGGSERGRHFAGKYCDHRLHRAEARRTLRKTRRRWTPIVSSRARNTAARSRSGRRRISFKPKRKQKRGASTNTS